MEKTVNQVYHNIGQFLINNIDEESWDRAVLDIDIKGKSVGMRGIIFHDNNTRKQMDISANFLLSLDVFDLHTITTEGGYNRWNRLEFTLFPDFKFIWDQELQDEVDGYNNKLKS